VWGCCDGSRKSRTTETGTRVNEYLGASISIYEQKQLRKIIDEEA
jgi:hypothetical protein